MKMDNSILHQCPALLLLLGLLGNFLNLASAQGGEPAIPEAAADSCFGDGKLEASIGEGILFSPFLSTHNRPTLNYDVTELQLGYMLTPVRGSCFWRGNVEVVGSVFDGWIVEGRGTYVAGATAFLRYNIVPRWTHFAPFLQAGAGATGTDLDRRIEGQDFNFNLNLGAGARYFFTPNWSLNLEYRYQHTSNANMSSHNLGVNADGPMLSLSYFF